MKEEIDVFIYKIDKLDNFEMSKNIVVAKHEYNDGSWMVDVLNSAYEIAETFDNLDAEQAELKFQEMIKKYEA